MKRGLTAAMATFTTSMVAMMIAAGIANAEPAAPKADAPCWGIEGSGALYDAQTLTPQGEVLICVKNDQGSQWHHLDGLQRPVETFFTYGPGAVLRASDILPATSWVSAPAGAGSVCTAVQTASDGGPPVTHTNTRGQYTDFLLTPNVASMELSGYCNWRKAWQRTPG
jgi:hypothetical protein